MANRFSMIPSVHVPRSIFDRSHQVKTTFDSGYLVPFYVDEALPGDTFTLDSTLFARMSTPITPVMDNVYMETFYFAVPVRLLWDNWQRFNGEVLDPNDPNETHDFLVPTITATNGVDVGSLSDYFGIPVNVPNLTFDSLWHRAYNLIYNSWFMDENLQSPAPVPTGDGPDNIDDFVLRRRGKRHDYFTSALPWPQKGDPISIGLIGNAPVYGGLNEPINMTALPSVSGISNTADKLVFASRSSTGSNAYSYGSPTLFTSGYDLEGGSRYPASFAKDVGLYADLSEITAITVNNLRQAFQLQRLLEKDARGGTRYTEILRSQFGVISPDARLQRPEYLGGSHARIHFNPVQQTSATDSTSPQGNLTAFALGSSSGRGFSKSFVEHNVIIGLVNIRADLTYQQGLNRMFSRRTRYDYYWPSLAYLGEQAVLNKEIYAQGTDADEDVFGYQERWSEYRYKPSIVTGKMRSGISGSLDIWHLAQKFDSLPSLNSDFIEDNPPIKRILAVQNEPEFLLDVDIRLKTARPMPVYSVPGLIDHF